jgi:hypothetical protein
MMSGTIDYRDGHLTFRDQTYDSSQPIRREQHWALMRATAREAQEWIGREASYDSGVVNVRLAPYQYQAFRLPGDQQALATIDHPVPPPKTRVEVRWHYGRWEKHLSAKGWVPA